jgi:hypothetical protein
MRERESERESEREEKNGEGGRGEKSLGGSEIETFL